MADASVLELVEFYREDIRILEGLGFVVVTETNKRAAAAADADALFAWWGGSSLPVVMAFRFRGRAVVVSGATGFRDTGDRASRRIPRFALTVVSSLFANRTLAVSDFELADLRRFGARRTVLGYHSVDVDYYRAGDPAPSPRAVTVGQMNRNNIGRKGIDLAIAATALIRRDVPTYELDVVGPISDDGADWLEGARHRLDFTGVNVLGATPRDEKRALLQKAWVYLQPSRYEAFGVAMVEAMACGTVPVHSDGGALAEVAGDGGVCLSTRTTQDVAQAVVDLVGHENRRAELSARARARALDFARPARAAQLADIFAKLGCRA